MGLIVILITEEEQIGFALIWASLITGTLFGTILISRWVNRATHLVEERVTNPPLSHLVFAGIIADPVSGAWLNGKTVTLYVNEKEIGKDKSALKSFRDSQLGPVDGQFIIEVKNPYELDLTLLNSIDPDINFRLATRIGGKTIGYRWIQPVHPGNRYPFKIEKKNLTYEIRVE
jgi:hypothetical protein